MKVIKCQCRFFIIMKIIVAIIISLILLACASPTENLPNTPPVEKTAFVTIDKINQSYLNQVDKYTNADVEYTIRNTSHNKDIESYTVYFYASFADSTDEEFMIEGTKILNNDSYSDSFRIYTDIKVIDVKISRYIIN